MILNFLYSRHKRRQYFKLEVNGTFLLLPFCLENTWMVLSKAMDTPYAPALNHFLLFLIENKMAFSSISQSIAQFFSIQPDALDKIDGRWPKIRKFSQRLKKAFIPKVIPTPKIDYKLFEEKSEKIVENEKPLLTKALKAGPPAAPKKRSWLKVIDNALDAMIKELLTNPSGKL
jgi:hypothetical protein